jgi:hypothetical protein
MNRKQKRQESWRVGGCRWLLLLLRLLLQWRRRWLLLLLLLLLPSLLFHSQPQTPSLRFFFNQLSFQFLVLVFHQAHLCAVRYNRVSANIFSRHTHRCNRQCFFLHDQLKP